MDFSSEGAEEFHGRVWHAITVVLFFFVILFLRVAYLQVVKGSYFRSFSTEYTIKEIKYPAPRGLVYDRNHVVLTDNRPSFSILVTPQYVQDPEKLLQGLNDLAGISLEEGRALWEKAKGAPAFYRNTFKKDVSLDVVGKIRAYRAAELIQDDPYDLYGVEVQAKPARHYPYADVAGMTLGHVSEVSPADLKKAESSGRGHYELGDPIGASGFEKSWEEKLRGTDGFEQQVVDATGQAVNSEEIQSLLVSRTPHSGNHLVSTLDAALQKYARERFGDRSGALVAMNPMNGAILSYLSRPSFDANLLSGAVSHEQWAVLAQDPSKPFLNRAHQSAYPPGSTYKIVLAVAALEEGLVGPEDTRYCPGHFYFGRAFRCWKEEGHGHPNLYRALVESCDVYFYQLGLKLGVDRIAKYAKILGLGQPTGINLEGEKAGLIPTTTWKKQAKGVDWIESETLSIAIGQGYDLVTPLQNALLISEIANGGRKIRPHLVDHFESPEGNIIPVERAAAEDLPLKKETMAFLQKALGGVVSEPSGTAHGLHWLGIPMAGKTGTAQVVAQKDPKMQGEYWQRDHAWFVAYAPLDNPEIAVSILVEHGGHGSSAAAPIAGDIIKEYFRLKAAQGDS